MNVNGPLYARPEIVRGQQRLLRNHSQVALLAGRLSFFDLRDPMGARAYDSMALDAAREAGDPHLSAVTLGHMSFVSPAGGGFTAALDLLEGADRYASRLTILPLWLAAVEAEIHAKAGKPRRPSTRSTGPRTPSSSPMKSRPGWTTTTRPGSRASKASPT